MAQTQTRKPEYLDLLNTICLQEERAGVWIQAWADNTQDPALKQCLDLVAARETSHYHIFKRRIEELGFELREEGYTDDPEWLRIANADVPDSEKIKSFEEMERHEPKPTVEERYHAAMGDEAVDPLTRSLLRWFAEVEADSGKVMDETYAKVEGMS